jgi:hypothetical protein
MIWEGIKYYNQIKKKQYFILIDTCNFGCYTVKKVMLKYNIIYTLQTRDNRINQFT